MKWNILEQETDFTAHAKGIVLAEVFYDKGGNKSMIRVGNLKLGIEEPESRLTDTIRKKLRINAEDILEQRIYKRALDARKKEDIHYVYTVDVAVKKEKKVLEHTKGKDITIAPDMTYYFPQGKPLLSQRPVVVGFGPGGMFAALLLAELGLRPIVLERGEDVEKRTKTVEAFWRGEGLQTESNVQFGEGGAGTFSDGKLTTRSKDLRCRKVLEELVEAGAPGEILYENKPHIGTDKLKGIVKNIRKKIIALGGEVRFESKMTDIKIVEGKVKAVIVNETERITTEQVLLAIGHSARDTFALLQKKGIALEQKPFAMGLRIEHLQEMVNQAQYGAFAEKLSPAEYKLTYTASNGRGVYTFCMCPGGTVVGAASEKGHLAINGMSEYARDAVNANSALLVQVFPEDFGDDNPLAGIAFQRSLEEKAFRAGGGKYSAPIQLLGDFLEGTVSQAFGEIHGSYQPQCVFCNLADILPSYMTEALREAIPVFGKRLQGFDRKDAVLTAIESRSSSPVRIVRNKERESISVEGLYPVGEGAGYAGGIVSAAIDGILAAEQIFLKCNQ